MLTLYEKKDKLAIHQKFGNNTMLAILDKSNEIKSIMAYYRESPDELLRTLQLMIIDLSKSVNVSKNMTPDQVKEAAILIVDGYKSLKLEEVYLVFKEIKQGKRIKINERLDAPLLISAFTSYYNERLDAAEQISLKKHSAYTTDPFSRSNTGSRNIKEILVPAGTAKAMQEQQQKFVQKKSKK